MLVLRPVSLSFRCHHEQGNRHQRQESLHVGLREGTGTTAPVEAPTGAVAGIRLATARPRAPTGPQPPPGTAPRPCRKRPVLKCTSWPRGGPPAASASGRPPVWSRPAAVRAPRDSLPRGGPGCKGLLASGLGRGPAPAGAELHAGRDFRCPAVARLLRSVCLESNSVPCTSGGAAPPQRLACPAPGERCFRLAGRKYFDVDEVSLARPRGPRSRSAAGHRPTGPPERC